MKKLLIFLVFVMPNLLIYAQEEGSVDAQTTKKLTKEQKSEQRRTEAEAAAKLVEWMVENKNFVLEANSLSDKYGNHANVSSMINFLAVDSNIITIQLASTSGIGGANGMGGVTTDGNITQFIVNRTGKNKSGYSIRLYTMTNIGSFDITFSILPNGTADASISGNWGSRLNYHGYLVPLKKSRVFRGMTI